MENRIDIFEVPKAEAAVVRTMDIHVEMNSEGCMVQRRTNAGTAFQNLKMTAFCISNLTIAALSDLDKLDEVVSPGAVGAQTVLADLRAFLTSTRDASKVMADMFQVKPRSAGGQDL